MHEMSIAQSLLREVLIAAAGHQARKVTGLTVRVGVFRMVEPSLLKSAFAVCARDSLADGAAVSIQQVAAKARCRQCDQRFMPEPLSFTCPQCGRADAEMIAGEELLLTNLDLEVQAKEVPA